MTLIDVPRATSTDLTEALRVLASSQHDVVGALERLSGPVAAEVKQLSALILLLQRRLVAFDEADVASHPGLRVPPLDGRAAAHDDDDSYAASLRQAEAALRGGTRHIELHDPQHPTITELVRLQTELVGKSLVPLVHVLAELVADADDLDRAILERGATAAATVS